MMKKRALTLLLLVCVITFFDAIPLYAAPAYVQSTSAICTTTADDPIAYTSNTTAGSLLIVVFSHSPAVTNVSVPTDTQGNTYTLLFSQTGATTQLDAYYAENTVGGANTVTFHKSAASAACRMGVLEYSGIKTTGSLDKTGKAFSSTGTTATSSAVTTTSANELIFGVMTTGAGRTVSAEDASWTPRINENTVRGIITEDINVTSATTSTAIFTWTSNTNWSAGIATFIAANESAPAPKPSVVLNSKAVVNGKMTIQ